MGATAYPTRERGGVVWAYMGPRQSPPDLPTSKPTARTRSARAAMRDSNWLRRWREHRHLPHGDPAQWGVDTEEVPTGTFAHYMVTHRNPRYAVVDHPVRTTYAAY